MELNIISSKISEIGIKNVKIYNSKFCISIYSLLYTIKIKKSNHNEVYIISKSHLGFLFQKILNKKHKEYIKNIRDIEDILISNGFIIMKIYYFPN